MEFALKFRLFRTKSTLLGASDAVSTDGADLSQRKQDRIFPEIEGVEAAGLERNLVSLEMTPI